MNNRIFHIALLFLLSPFVQRIQAQSSISINGKITSSANQRPIRRANVSIDKKGVGTATNTAGMFALIIPAANLADTLKISCVGYQTKAFAIAGLKNGQTLDVSLEKTTTELQEVTIGYYEPMKIIQKALDRIAQNYINHPHIIRGFYRMYTYNDANPLQLSEAVFDVYNFGYADKRSDLFKLEKARNEKNNRDFAFLEFGQKPNTIFEADVVNHLYTSGFLSDEGLTKHTYEVAGIVDIKGYKAYEVDFKEKPGAEGSTFRGQMFIDTKTYAFIYFDFGLSPSGLTEPGAGNFLEKSLIKIGDVQVGLQEDHSKVSYQEVGNKWVLSDVEGDDAITVKSDGQKADFLAHVKFNYQITAVDTTEKTSFSSKLGGTININAYKSSADEKFWKDYNILLSDYNTEDIYKQIRDINKAIK